MTLKSFFQNKFLTATVSSLHGLFTSHDCSSFDTQLCNFVHQWPRLAGWGFHKVASNEKIVTKSHSDTQTFCSRIFVNDGCNFS